MLPAYRQILAQLTAPSTRLLSPGVSKSRKPTLILLNGKWNLIR